MEELNAVTEKLKELSTKLKKVGRDTRSVEWTAAKKSYIADLELKLDDIINYSTAEVVEERFVKTYDEASKLVQNCKIILDTIKTSKSKTMATGKQNFDLNLALKMLKEYNGHSSVNDYIDSINLYNDLLTDEGSILLVDFVYRHCLKEEAKRAFVAKPATVDDLVSTLRNRFKVRDTIAGINFKMANTFQGNRSVHKYAMQIEQLMGDLIELHIATRGEEAREIVNAISQDAACAAFKAGLRPELQTAVIAADKISFSDILTKALETEAALNNVAQVNAVRYVHSRGGQGYDRKFNTPFVYRGENHRYFQNNGHRFNYNNGYNRGNSFGHRQPRNQFSWRHPNQHFRNNAPNQYDNHSRNFERTNGRPGLSQGNYHSQYTQNGYGNVHLTQEEQRIHVQANPQQNAESGDSYPQVNIAEETFFRSQ